jgi:hypothetical protein
VALRWKFHNAKPTGMNTIDFLDKLDLQAEQRLILQDIGWQEYLAIDSVLEEVPGLLKQWRVSGDR